MIDSIMQPPASAELEELILGAILLEQETYLEHAHLLNTELWYWDKHRHIYDAIKSLNVSNSPIDIATCINQLRKNGKLDEIGGAFTVTSLTSKLVSSANIGEYIAIVTQHYLRRELIRLGGEIISNAYNQMEDVFTVIDSVESGINNINESILGNEAEGDIHSEIEESYRQIISQESEITGIKTGNGDLTRMLKGLNDGDLIVWGGRPSAGKTARVMQMMNHIGLEEKKKGAFFSLETSKKKIHRRQFLNISECYALNQPPSQRNIQQQEAIYNAKEELKKANIYIWDGGHLTPNKLISLCRRRKRKYGLDYAVIDHLQLMQPDGKFSNPVQAMTELTRKLKLAAKNLNIPIVVLSQLSRKSAERTNKRPMLSDLRESGSIEQDADVVVFMFSPAEFYENPPDSGLTDLEYGKLTEMIVAKNKDGELGTIKELFDKYIQKFYDIPGKEINTQENLF